MKALTSYLFVIIYASPFNIQVPNRHPDSGSLPCHEHSTAQNMEQPKPNYSCLFKNRRRKKRAAKHPKPTKAPALTKLYFDNSASLANGSLAIYLHNEVSVVEKRRSCRGRGAEEGPCQPQGRRREAAQVWGRARPYLGVGVQGVGQLAGAVTRCRVAQHGVEGLRGGSGELSRGGSRLDHQEQRQEQEEDGEASPLHRHLRSSAPAAAASSLSRDVALTELTGKCGPRRGASPPIP